MDKQEFFNEIIETLDNASESLGIYEYIDLLDDVLDEADRRMSADSGRADEREWY